MTEKTTATFQDLLDARARIQRAKAAQEAAELAVKEAQIYEASVERALLDSVSIGFYTVHGIPNKVFQVWGTKPGVTGISVHDCSFVVHVDLEPRSMVDVLGDDAP